MTLGISISVIMLSVAFSYCYAECHYGECRYDECCKYFIFSIMSFFGYQSFAQSRVVQTSHRGVTAVHSTVVKLCI